VQTYLRLMADISKSRFLLASLHIEAILRETSIAQRGRRLKAVKNGVGLADAYGATLGRIQAQGEQKTKLAIATLTWICHAERPLEVDELCHALAVEIGSTDFDSENAPSIGAVLGCCQGLITVDHEASTVRLIHYTVKEYLCTHPDLFSRPHSVIAETCLTYLNSQQIKSLPSYALPDHQIVPFLKYSSRYWGAHAKRELSHCARVLALELLGNYEDHISALSLSKQVLPPRYVGDIGASPHFFSALHCASFFGIIELVTALMNASGSQINQRDCGGNTPLLWASKNGHDGVVKLLLRGEGIDPNGPDSWGYTPLSWAAYIGHELVVKLLLGREDVESNRPCNHGETPLGWAAINGHEGVVKLLLARDDIDPNHLDENNRTPLGCAAVEGHEGVVKLLLDRKDVDPNHQDIYHRTPLASASLKGHEGVVKLLLERDDTDPNRPNELNRTPLGTAAAWGHEGVVKLLLDRKDVDPNRPDGGAITPLGCAACWGREGAAKLLLARDDVDPNYPDMYDQTPLGCAASKGYEEVVSQLLRRADVEPNRPGRDGRTPLQCAVKNGHEGVIKLLQARISMESVDAQSLHQLAKNH